MKIKIGDKCYESNGEPVVIILDIFDKNNVSNMTQNMYFSFPNAMTPNKMRDCIGLNPIKEGLRILSKSCDGCMFNGENCENYKLCHKDENGYYTEYISSSRISI